MICFYYSEPERGRYRKRMHQRWKEIGVFACTEQRVAGQSRAIRTNGWLSAVELSELKKEVLQGNNDLDVDREPDMEEQPDVEYQPDVEIQPVMGRTT